MSHYQNIAPAPIERFEKIYESSYSRLYNFVKHYIWSEDAVKDVLQECYIRVWENLSAITDDEKLMPLLRTYATNITIDMVRKKSKEMERAIIYHAQQSDPAAADASMNLRELLRIYHEAVSGLPPQQRKIFQLIREKGLSYREISAELDISPNTVKRHMHEALRALRSKFPSEILLLLMLLERMK